MAVSRDRLTFLLQQIAGLCPAKCRNEMFSGLNEILQKQNEAYTMLGKNNPRRKTRKVRK